MAAINLDHAICTDEENAAKLLSRLILVAMNHRDAVGVDVLDAALGLRIIGRDDLDWPGAIHAKAPLSDIEMMSAPVGHHAAGVLAIVAPVGEVPMNAARTEDRVVGTIRRR